MTRRCALLVLAVAGCSPKGPPPAAPPEPPAVTVEHPVERTLDSYAEFTGFLDAVERQQVRAQVSGYLKEVKFKDGDSVQKGQELFVIDPLPFRAAVDSAKAAVAKSEADLVSAQANLTKAERDLDRARTTAGLSKQEADNYLALRDAAAASRTAAEATIAANKAAQVTAEFNLSNTVVRSDVSVKGRVSRTQVTPGNFVTAGQTVLCTVYSLDPIFAYWVVDEQTSLAYRTAILDKKELADPRNPNGPGLKCFVGMRDEAGFPHPGRVSYVAPEIVRGTGTREVRATLDNPAPYRMGPGDSIRVRVESGAAKKAITIPEMAVGSQQRQRFVYVIGADKEGKEVAEFRPVALGAAREVGGARLQIIESGLTPADRVIVNGLLRVRPGLPVKAELQASPVPAGAK